MDTAPPAATTNTEVTIEFLQLTADKLVTPEIYSCSPGIAFHMDFANGVLIVAQHEHAFD